MKFEFEINRPNWTALGVLNWLYWFVTYAIGILSLGLFLSLFIGGGSIYSGSGGGMISLAVAFIASQGLCVFAGLLIVGQVVRWITRNLDRGFGPGA